MLTQINDLKFDGQKTFTPGFYAHLCHATET